MSDYDICPLCNADLRDKPIPEEYRQHYGDKTHYSRLIAIVDPGRDRVVAYMCPDCGERWPR